VVPPKIPKYTRKGADFNRFGAVASCRRLLAIGEADLSFEYERGRDHDRDSCIIKGMPDTKHHRRHAGHVDHGKTTLIRALTGIDTDS